MMEPHRLSTLFPVVRVYFSRASNTLATLLVWGVLFDLGTVRLRYQGWMSQITIFLTLGRNQNRLKYS